MKSTTEPQFSILKQNINKQNINKIQQKRQSQLSSTQHHSALKYHKKNKSSASPQSHQSPSFASTYQKQLEENPLKFIDFDRPTIAQTLRLNQTVQHFQQQLKLCEKYQQNQHNFINETLKKIANDIDTNMKNGTQKIENLLEELKGLSSTNECQFTLRNSKNSQTLSKFGLQNQAFDEFQTNKLIPLFSTLKSIQLQQPYNRNTKTITTIDLKVKQQLCPQLSTEQSQSREQLVKLVDYSNNELENLQNLLEELNKLASDKLCAMEEKVQVFNYDLEGLINNNIQLRKKQERMIQQLIEKMIYKAAYL